MDEGAMPRREGDGRWHLLGLDAFSGEVYPVDGDFEEEGAAREAAQRELEALERTQPSASSGGQSGIQDRIYIVGPDGSGFRVLPPESTVGG